MEVTMNFKALVVRMIAVFVLAGLMLTSGTTLSKAAEGENSYTNKEVRMLASIIFCEAGNQSYAGKLAVGIVVMNRKRSRKFPGTVEKVIKQKNQFTPVRTGKYAKELKKYKKGSYKKGARAQCVKAAKEALGGKTTVRYRGKTIQMKRYLFFSQHLRNAKLRIGGHDFKIKF